MELRRAETSAAYVLRRLGSMRDANPHLRLLDVGAGPGTISVGLAEAIPDGFVTAIDLNPEILPRARAVADQAGIQNIKFQQGDVHRLPFEDGIFDITHCHQLLTHIAAPWDALREMLRVTKPGGIVAAREGDYETECIWPESSGLLKFHKIVATMMKGAGGTTTAGRQLLSWAIKAGVHRDQITLSYDTSLYSKPEETKAWCESYSYARLFYTKSQ
jgi:ubiquinone/menaquinone biosynthesis C-methylase UbiE